MLELPPQFAELLDGLRRRIRAYVLVEGTARVVCLAGLLFWFTLLGDWLWFRVSRLELPVWLRSWALGGSVALLVAGLLFWIALRFLPSLRAKALALVLERRFPELDDRLITAVEMAEAPSPASPLTQAMLQRTVNDAAKLVPNLEVGNVFDKRTLQRVIAFAGVLVASIVGLGVANAEAMDRWYKAYVLRLDRYWHRETELVARVLVPPSDRPRPFRDHHYKHAKGSDLTLVVDLPEGKRPDGGDWQTPAAVELIYALDGDRGGGSVMMSRFGDRQFRHTFGGLLDGMRFWIKGGDYTNRVPYRVEAVDPPKLDQILLDCDFPAYTGWNERGLRAQKAQGAQISIPVETRFVFRGEANKPLRHVRLEFGPNRLSFGFASPPEPSGEHLTGTPSGNDPAKHLEPAPETYQAEWLIESEDRQSRTRQPLDEAVARKFLSDDRRRFLLPVVLSAQETEPARERAKRPFAATEFGSDFGRPFVLPPDTPVRIYLEDADEIVALEPIRLTINGTVDEPPLVKTELRGIGSSITRKAIIPVAGKVSDDYGITEVRFDFRIDDEPEWTPRPLRGKLKVEKEGDEAKTGGDRPKEFELAADPKIAREDASKAREEFDVLQLELPIGKKLSLTVFATDADDLNGPHVGRGEQYVFTIVSDEELLSILYGREVTLRQRFKQIMDEIDNARKDLILHRAKYAESVELKKDGGDQKKADELQTSVAVCAERSLHQIRKNAGETASVEQSFRALLEELVNNRIHTEQVVHKYSALIVAPLHAINEVDFPAADGSVGLFKLANEKRQDPTAKIDQSVETLTDMLDHMQRVLKEMQELADFHEKIQELKRIIEDVDKLKKETAAERKKKDLEKLKGLD